MLGKQGLLLATVFVLAHCRPQDFAFPDESQEDIPTRLNTPRPVNSSTQPPPTTSTTATASDQTTTRIPPRDPANRIVYSVSCPCTFTPEYNPVCGTDGQTYGNIGVFQCTKQCGKDVELYLRGACGRNNG